MAAGKWLHQQLDGQDRYIQVAEAAVPQHVQAGWLPCDAPPVVPVELVRPAPAPPRSSRLPRAPRPRPSAPSPSPSRGTTPEEN